MTWLARATGVRDHEAAAALWSCAYFFCLLSGYYAIRPIRDALGLAGGVNQLEWLFMGTLGAMLLAQPLFGWLTSRWPRRVFVPVVYRFFALNLLVFFTLLAGREEPGVWTARAFFIWTSVFNLFVVSIFWGFMADVWRADQGKRLFGFIGAGGTLGAIAGAAATGLLVQRLSPAGMMLISVALMEGAVRCARAVGRRAGSATDAAQPLSKDGALGAVTQVARSPYLLGVSGYMLCYTVGSTLVYFEQGRIVSDAFADSAARAAAFARIDVGVNTLTLALQLFATGRIVRWAGVGRTLAVMPILTGAGLLTLSLWPAFGALAAFQILRRGVEYGLVRPARESLYTVAAREEKFKAKTFIDTFVYRGGDAVGAWSSAGLRALGVASGAAFAPVAVGWAGLALWLGWRMRRRERAGTPAAA